MRLSEQQLRNIEQRSRMEIRYLQLALACAKLNLRHLRPGENTTHDNYLKALENRNALTHRVMDAILRLYGTDVERMHFVLHVVDAFVARGHELGGRGSC
jgi:hypothetical protein